MHRKTETTLQASVLRGFLAASSAALLILAGSPAFAQQAAADGSRQLFDQEICQADGLQPAECDCAWNAVQAKMPERDLRLAMLLLASNSADPATARKADEQLDKNNASDRKRDSVAQEIGAVVIEAEDACMEL